MRNFVLVKSYYGWGGDLAILSEAISLAYEKKLNLIIDWRGGFNGANHAENIFDYLFDVECPRADIHELNHNINVIPDFWSSFLQAPTPFSNEYPLAKCSRDTIDGLFNNPKEPYVVVLTRESSKFYLPEFQKNKFESFSRIKPKKFILAQIDNYINIAMGHEVIGIHFRHGNGERTVVYPDINWYFNEIDKFIQIAINPKILICTDCSAALLAFRKRYGEMVFSTNKNYLPIGAGGMHYSNNLEERIRSGVEAIIDIWLLSFSKYFIGTKSFFSYAVNGVAGGFDKGNIKTYVHRIRSFKPEDDLMQISEEECSDIFGSLLNNIDGIYIKKIDGAKYIYLQDQLIGQVGDDQNKLLELIKSIRLY